MEFITFCEGSPYGPLLTGSAASGSGYSTRHSLITKIVRVVKITSFLLFLCCLHVAASTHSQTITFSGRDVPLEKVFTAIKKQSDFLIVYNKDMLKRSRPVSVDVKNFPLADFLQLTLADQGISFLIENKTIILKIKPVAAGLSPQINIETAPPITGIIRGSDGQPIAGANIIIKGTKRGTASLADGSFTIEAKEGEVLIVSSVGYTDKEIIITSTNVSSDVTLELSQSKLDEVQIIAYGKTSQRQNVGNVTTINSKELSQQPVNNPLLALSGRVPGMTVQQTSGIPGAIPKIQIRGRNSLNSGSGVFLEPEPLYIIDGIPVNSEIQGGPGSLGNGIGNGSALALINIGDIESISVLKDASQTSIYGSRGANGVVLITTKQGKAGQTKVDLNISQGFGKVTEKLDLLNRREYLDMRYEALKNDGITTIPNTAANYDLTRYDTTRYTDWQKELIGGTAKYSNAQASLTGGTSLVQYFAAGSFQRETAVTPGDFYNTKGSFHLGVNGKSKNEKFFANFKTSYLIDNNTLPNADFTASAITLAPVAPALYRENGSLNWANSTWTNPVAKIFEPFDFNNTVLTGSTAVGYNILNNLQAKINAGYNRIRGESYTATPFAAINPDSWPGSVRNALFQNTDNTSWIIEPQLSFNKSIHQLSLDLLAGATLQNNKTNIQYTTATGSPSDDLIGNLNSHTNFNSGNSGTEYKYSAVFARASGDYAKKYLFNFSVRRDGSSRFGPGRQFGTFAAGGLGWIFTEEKWAHNNLPFLSFGKLRASYGSTGGDAIGDYKFMELYEQAINNYQGIRALISSGIYNSEYAWESTKKLEFGIELGLFNDRILANISYYRNRSSNQLIDYQYSSVVGPGTVKVNFPALIQNAGMEFGLNTTNIKTTSFQWSSSFNISFNRNKLVKFPGIESSSYSYYRIGEPISALRLYHLLGVDPETGVYVFADKEGKPTSTPDFLNDANTYINLTPEYYGGLQNAISFQGFTLDFLFQFVKQTGLNFSYSRSLLPGRFSMFGLGNQPVSVLDRWQQPGDNASYQRFSQNSSILNIQNTARNESDQVYSDASFIRLKNLSFSYAVNLKNNNSIKTLRFFIQGQNLLTFTNYKGLDPETQNVVSLPPLKIITFGVQAAF